MIKCISPDQYLEHQGLEDIFNDQNDFEWKIKRLDNDAGFMLAYFGPEYFRETYLQFDTGQDCITIENTGYFQFQADISVVFAQKIRSSCTDDIWDEIEFEFRRAYTDEEELLGDSDS